MRPARVDEVEAEAAADALEKIVRRSVRLSNHRRHFDRLRQPVHYPTTKTRMSGCAVMSTELDAGRRRVLCAAAGAIAAASLPGLAHGERAPARAIDLVGAPSNLGLRPLRPGHIPGAKRAPGVLRAHRIVERLGARDRGDVEAPAYDPSTDPATGYRNGANLVAYTPR